MSLRPVSLPETCTCYYCGLTHRKVEAGGVYHCPNALCTGCGATWFRMRMKSYVELDGGPCGKHAVDPQEMLVRGLAYAYEIDDPVIAEKIRESAEKWKEQDGSRPPMEPDVEVGNN